MPPSAISSTIDRPSPVTPEDGISVALSNGHNSANADTSIKQPVTPTSPHSPQFGKRAADEQMLLAHAPPPPCTVLRTTNKSPSSSPSSAVSVATTTKVAEGATVTKDDPANAKKSCKEEMSLPSSSGLVTMDLVSNLEASNPQQAARAWSRLGQVHQRQRKFTEARSAYNRAVELDGSQHGSLANLAQLEAHAGNADLAQDLLTRALALDPTNAAYCAFGRWLQGARPPLQVGPASSRGSSAATEPAPLCGTGSTANLEPHANQ